MCKIIIKVQHHDYVYYKTDGLSCTIVHIARNKITIQLYSSPNDNHSKQFRQEIKFLLRGDRNSANRIHDFQNKYVPTKIRHLKHMMISDSHYNTTSMIYTYRLLIFTLNLSYCNIVLGCNYAEVTFV